MGGTRADDTGSEAELAEYYDADRGDADMWGEPEPVGQPERLDVRLSVRFTRAEIARVRQAAEAATMKPTVFIRQAALSQAHPVAIERVSADLDPLAELVSVPCIDHATHLRRSAGTVPSS